MKNSPFKNPISKKELDAEYKKNRNIRYGAITVSFFGTSGLMIYTTLKNNEGGSARVELIILAFIMLFIATVLSKFFVYSRENSYFAECTPDEIDTFYSYAKNGHVKEFIAKINKHQRKPTHYELVEVQDYLDSIDDNQAYNDFKSIGQ